MPLAKEYDKELLNKVPNIEPLYLKMWHIITVKETGPLSISLFSFIHLGSSPSRTDILSWPKTFLINIILKKLKSQWNKKNLCFFFCKIYNTLKVQ